MKRTREIEKESEIKSAIEELSMLIKLKPTGDNHDRTTVHIPTKPFIYVCSLVIQVLDKIGPTMTVLRQDIDQNIQRLKMLCDSDPSMYSNLVEILKKEANEGGARKGASCSKASVWLARSLDFTVALLQRLVADPGQEMEKLVEESYNITLKPWHGWISSAAYKVALKLVPDNKTLINLLMPKDETYDTLKEDMQTLISLLVPFLEEIHSVLVPWPLPPSLALQGLVVRVCVELLATFQENMSSSEVNTAKQFHSLSWLLSRYLSGIMNIYANNTKAFKSYPRGDFDLESGTLRRSRKSKNSSLHPSKMIKCFANRLNYFYKLHPFLLFFISLSFGVTILIVLFLYESRHRTMNDFGKLDLGLNDYPFANLSNLVMVAGHSVYTSSCGKVDREDSWFLESYQKHPGQAATFVAHIQEGVEIVSKDDGALLLFSGGETRKNAGPRSEAQSYWAVAESKGWFSNEESVRWRALTEEHARDSFENLLFSVCRFRELTGKYPQNITVVSYDFKGERFANLHRSAISFPESRFFYAGTPASSTSKEAALKGESLVRSQFQEDPYGCKGENPSNVRGIMNIGSPYLGCAAASST
ncbi:hypothetical protein D5086_026637 [Populus alba]|uniref:Uncharacterized protein n=1 Tax=Populus alba TaxID=43335 RepID=A0ACC4B438_POPAL